jgi:hypothetical protein
VSTQAVHCAAGQAAPNRENQKAARAAAFRSYIPVFGHEVNENVCHAAVVTGWDDGFSPPPAGKLGKTEKTDSGCPADSCHGVSR